MFFFTADPSMNNNATSSSSSSSRPLPPDSFKNNLVKAKTAEVDALNPRLASPSSSTSANPNLTNGESPPPKEVPDMSSATFVSVVSFLNYVFRASLSVFARVCRALFLSYHAHFCFLQACTSSFYIFRVCVLYILNTSTFLLPQSSNDQGGDKLTLSLNNTLNGGGTGAAAAAAAAAAAPSPGSRPTVSSSTADESSSSPSSAVAVAKLINLDSPGADASGVVSSTTGGEEGEGGESVCVTHFSPASDGSGAVERETLFSDAIAAMLTNGNGGSKNPFTNGASKNPFLDANGEALESSEGGKYATIGRSNPFSSSPTSTSTSNNPFLQRKDEKDSGGTGDSILPATTKTLNKIVSTLAENNCAKCFTSSVCVRPSVFRACIPNAMQYMHATNHPAPLL